MKIEQVHRLIDDVEIGEVFQHDNNIWIKTNASHEKAGFQCVIMHSGNLMYIDKKTKVTEVKVRLLVLTPLPR